MDPRHASVTTKPDNSPAIPPADTDDKPANGDKPTTIKADASPPVPRLLDGDVTSMPIRPTRGCLINVGDFIAKHGDGTGCPASNWPRTGDVRRTFAAAFLGCSAGYVDPGRLTATATPPARITITRGGNWSCPVRGPVKDGDLLGPAVDQETGVMSANVLERVENADEAIAVAVKATAPLPEPGLLTADKPRGLWRVRMNVQGIAPWPI